MNKFKNQIGQIMALNTTELLPDRLRLLLRTFHLEFEASRVELLKLREEWQKKWDQGQVPQYIQSHPAQESNWKVAPIPQDLMQRRVEITGPVNSPKMVINMLNPTADGEIADMAMLDFEDSMKPTWENVLQGHNNIISALKNELTYVAENGKSYSLNKNQQAHIMIRVRGLHLNEENFLVDGEPISAGIFDLVTSAFHTAYLFLRKKQTPKYYIPKCESHQEAKWWNSIFRRIELELGLDQGQIRCTFLIETLPAAFEMEEILYEIRERACGLNGGRWDKIFSDIKVLKNHPDRILANRSYIDMTRPWMENYAKRLIKICHKHGAFAMGGMSAFTPGKDPETRLQQTEKVRADKAREAAIGHDGCWVSHPYFIGVAKAQFKKINQLDVQLEDFPSQPELLPESIGPKTLDGLRTNLRVGIAYQKGWNEGLGCISWDGLMEDLATLEISRAQVWQWLHHKVILDDGTAVTRELVLKTFDEEYAKILEQTSEEVKDPSEYLFLRSQYLKALEEISHVFLQPELSNFFTIQQQGIKHEQQNSTNRDQHNNTVANRTTLAGH